ncbi:hypothetical protein AB0451_39970 [Streptomyces sp. NPDC052000]|uniref:hypothetical protein n=1 Tax=Streptomyces sp. NPDC052000 TaxID=3155676 RepID=UPI003450F279
MREHQLQQPLTRPKNDGQDDGASPAHGSTIHFTESGPEPATALAALMSVVGERDDQLPALTVICTYDSLDKIEATVHTLYSVPAFDLAVHLGVTCNRSTPGRPTPGG